MGELLEELLTAEPSHHKEKQSQPCKKTVDDYDLSDEHQCTRVETSNPSMHSDPGAEQRKSTQLGV